MQHICEGVLENEVRVKRPKKDLFKYITGLNCRSKMQFTLTKRRNRGIDSSLTVRESVWGVLNQSFKALSLI